MKTKNLYLSFLVAVISIFGLTSCDKDSEKDITLTSLKGTTWIYVDDDYLFGDDWIDLYDYLYSITFYSEDEGYVAYFHKITSSNMGTTYDKSLAFFKYTIDGDQINVKYFTDRIEDSYDTYYYYDDKIYSSGPIYYKKDPKGIDWDFLKTIKGSLGDINWYYNPGTKSYKLYLIGEGYMPDYNRYSDTPWAKNDNLINEVKIGENITSVGDCSFANINVSKVELPSTLKRVGKYAFSGSLIREVDLKNVEIVDMEAFSKCKDLREVGLNKNSSLAEIGECAFYYCEKLDPSFLTNTPNLKRLGRLSFFGFKVKYFTNSEVLEYINSPFSDLDISVLKFPKSLKEIRGLITGTFKEIRLGSKIEALNDVFFVTTARTGTMYVDQTKPAQLRDDIINNYQNNWTLYVPNGCANAYKNAANWKNFKYIYEDPNLTGRAVNQ